MGTQIAEDLTHPAHLSQAEQALDDIDPRDYDLDAIAFVVAPSPKDLPPSSPSPTTRPSQPTRSKP
jgi:hypothetical protein